jgi:capsular exopolysaccharide synthesis family protein
MARSDVDLRAYLTVLAKRWLLIAAIVLLSVSASVGVTFLTPPTYQAHAQLFVSTQVDAGNAAQLQQGGTFSTARVKSYTNLATSPKVLDPVIAQLGLQLTAAQVASKVRADAPLDTVLINITVNDGASKSAAALANAVGDQLTKVIQELETPTGSRTSPVKATIVSQAVPADSPISPSLPINTALGLLVGLVLGVGVAVLRDKLDTSVKDAKDLARISDVPVLATIARDPVAAKEPIVRGDTHGSRSEEFRHLRTNLQFASVDDKPKIIIVTSSFSAEGKSSVAGNLAMALAQAGVRVCLVDGDLRRPSVADYFGLVAEAGLTTALVGRARITDVAQPVAPGLVAITSGPIPPNPSELLASDRAASALRELAQAYDMVLVDAPPVLPVADAAVLATRADGVLFVVRAGKTGHQHVEQAIRSLRQVQGRVLGTVLNMATPRGRKHHDYSYDYSSSPHNIFDTPLSEESPTTHPPETSTPRDPRSPRETPKPRPREASTPSGPRSPRESPNSRDGSGGQPRGASQRPIRPTSAGPQQPTERFAPRGPFET